ncbi:coniferyl aldehyde dehydrogenase [Piscinibacter gummiphilus]|uniref:Aldehyde dehydrogenase n=1 Tax=Piscinibacter gummiphilus TaxID=946333 RepID=A0A1W6L616_9BURK|nr:coniferyl aldehyde dehydrogenase [Piscinibacter gummiphilus]ARN19662.1 coniferyl-aldehyde dehydrogenase [Piscinibacter gummiphilus]ATU64330.1 coniferyl aldehyde dehydrogenase [Piscinibacter gummiphilus]GLS95279.1 aldehyde dehydrogenase [Piscinibacter gummiphilus]
MNDRLAPHETTGAGLAGTFAAQRAAFARHPFPVAAERRGHLRALKRQLLRYQDVLADAMSRDFGHRAHAESKMLDVLASTLEINHAISHVRRWMRPSRRATELLFLTNRLRVTYQPKGVVGVIVPWNFPLYLALGPLAAALAAGNRVMVKMPEVTPATNAVLRCLLAEVFPADHVAVVGEELADPNAFTSLPFDHIVFTGSPAVGRIVMRTASQNLTPVTLELGGKSPAVVTRGYPVAEAAARIAHGKSTNAGQICVSPDYALVPRELVPEFVAEVRAAFGRSFGESVANHPDYTSIVNDRHHRRMVDLLDDARAKGATVLACGGGGLGRRLPLQVVTGVTDGMKLMQEEIFGPILPVVPYDTLDDAIARIRTGPRPLALYAFGHDTAERERLLKNTHSGGVTVNDWGWHVMNHDAPFGGVGNSGMGTYHGIEGFRELSHARTVFKRHRFYPIGLFYPPYGNFVQRLVLRLWLGKADPTLASNTAGRH